MTCGFSSVKRNCPHPNTLLVKRPFSELGEDYVLLGFGLQQTLAGFFVVGILFDCLLKQFNLEADTRQHCSDIRNLGLANMKQTYTLAGRGRTRPASRYLRPLHEGCEMGYQRNSLRPIVPTAMPKMPTAMNA